MAKTIEELKKNIKEAIKILDNMQTCIHRSCGGSEISCDECRYKVNADDYHKAYWLRERSLKAWNDALEDIQRLRNCSCSTSDGIIDDIEDIINKHLGEVNI